jgi:hypothetical protein
MRNLLKNVERVELSEGEAEGGSEVGEEGVVAEEVVGGQAVSQLGGQPARGSPSQLAH